MSTTPQTRLFGPLLRAAACDAALLRRYPKLLWSALGAVLVPALYALIVLSSIWDPNARTAQLPVGLVNQDIGLRYGSREVRLGAEVMQALRTQGLFGYREFDDAEAARQAVRQGRLAFAVLLPPDFSHQALLGAEPGAGRLILHLSEGNNYAAAGLARRFAPELAHQVNETLNERRWALVFDATAGSRRDLTSLRQGVDRLVDGAARTAAGAHRAREGSQAMLGGLANASDAGQRLQTATVQLADGAAQFGSGLRQLGAGLRAIDAHTPQARDLQALHQGGLALQQGQSELGAGLQQLQDGSARLRDGVNAYRLKVGELPFIGEEFALAAGPLQSGAEQLERGLGSARDAQGRLAEGTSRFAAATDQLADGLQRQSTAISLLVAQLPEDARAASFAAGAAETARATAALADGLRRLYEGQALIRQGLAQLDDGSAALSDTLRLLKSSLPADPASLDGTPAGLAHSVQPVLEVVATVANDGAGFSPNFVPLALWMGAVMTAFLFHFRRLPAELMAAPRAVTIAGRLVFPALVVAGQSLVMLAMLVGVLQVQVERMLPVAATLLAASLLFLSLVFALVHLFGDVGKLVTVLLLVVQMSAAGALLPVELTAPVFQALHPWLPLTWVVRTYRASLFGAYDGASSDAWLAMLATGVASLALAATLGRWRSVPAAAYRPTMEID
jgi:putative membrane protein